MTVKLQQEDFRRVVEILQSHTEFKNARDRRRLVEGALEGSPRADTILASLDLEGAPKGAAVEVVKVLADFGQVAYGKEALGVLLNYLQDIVGDEQAEFLAGLYVRYPLNDVAAIRQRPIDQWRGSDTPEELREKVIGENTLRDISMLERALDAARAVVRVGLPSGAGSGFMITSDLVMTNNHVIASLEEASRAEFTFNYQLDRSGNALEPMTVGTLPSGLFHTNAALDYSVVQLRNPPDFGAPLTLRPVLSRRDERVSIIQHPAGQFKKISIQNNFVAYADRQVLQYTTTTLPGSSGAPVFDDAFQVVAIHREGGVLQEPGSEQRYLRNGGTSMIALLADLKENAPTIYTCLNA